MEKIAGRVCVVRERELYTAVCIKIAATWEFGDISKASDMQIGGLSLEKQEAEMDWR